MLRRHKSWKELTRFYQFALGKLEPIDSDDKRAEQLRMWAELGELYADPLGNPDSAVVALEVARTLDPSPRRRQRLATVCTVAGGRHIALAIAEHRALVAEDKTRIASYRALKELCLETGRADEAAACAEALACLKADEGEVAPTPPVEPRRPLTPELWAGLRHPDQSRELTTLFALVAPQVAASRAQRARTPLSRQRLVAADDARPFARAFRRAAAAFGLGAAPLAIAGEQAAAATLACAVDGQRVVPVLVLGAPLVDGGRDEGELLFAVARAAAQLAPEQLHPPAPAAGRRAGAPHRGGPGNRRRGRGRRARRRARPHHRRAQGRAGPGRARSAGDDRPPPARARHPARGGGARLAAGERFSRSTAPPSSSPGTCSAARAWSGTSRRRRRRCPPRTARSTSSGRA